MDTQTLLVGATGGIVTLFGKYVIDRLTESHKADVSLQAKRRERYYDRQAIAVAGMYERLTKLAHVVDDIRVIMHDVDSSSVVAEFRKIGLDKALPAAEAASDEMWSYFAMNEMYLSEHVSGRIRALGVNLDAVVVEARHSLRLGLENVTEDQIKRIADCRSRARLIIETLHEMFLALMLGEQRSSLERLWERLRMLRRRKPAPPSPAPPQAP